MRGRDKGAASLNLANLVGGVVDVTGVGMTMGTGEFFVVSAGQTLQRYSQGNITGTIDIEGLGGIPLGTFDITKGKSTGQFTKLKLAGTLTIPPAGPVKIQLTGVRYPDTLPILTGRDIDSKLSGNTVKSKFYDITISEDGVFGFPVFIVEGIGPVRVDGVETSVEIDGLIIRGSKGNGVFGTTTSPELGDGMVTGNLKEAKKRFPKGRFKVSDTRSYRALVDLREAVDPRISVQPSEIDFGDVNIGGGEPPENFFTVKNVGTGILTGEAKIETSDQGFLVTSGSPYTLGEDEETTMGIRFTPPSTGNFQTDVTFSGGGEAIGVVKGEGVSGGGS